MMSKPTIRRLILYPAAALIAVALVVLTRHREAQEQRNLIGTLQSGGELMARMGFADKAEDNANRILALDPRNLEARLLLAYTHQRSSRYGDAIREYQESLKLSGTEDQRNYIELVIADLYRLDGKCDEAQRRLDAFRRAHGDEPRAAMVQGQVYADLDDHAKAAECFRHAAEADPPVPGALLSVANSRLQLGQKRPALEAYEMVAKSGARTGGLWYRVAELRRDLGDQTGARIALRTAYQREPGSTKRLLAEDAEAWGGLTVEQLQAESNASKG